MYLKYTIKATIFNNFGTCETKIRVWDDNVNNSFARAPPPLWEYNFASGGGAVVAQHGLWA